MTQKWSKRFARASCALVTCIAMSVTASAAGGYSDINENDWFWSAVSYVTENNLMDGRNGKFEPGADLTRADLSVALYRMAGSPTASGTMPFSDVASNTSCRDAVLWAYENEVITGIKDDNTGQLTFVPNGSIRRQDVAVMLQRYANGNIEEADLSIFTDANQIKDYAKSAMNWAVAIGIYGGNSNGAIMPLGNISRAQTATILQRFESITSAGEVKYVVDQLYTTPDGRSMYYTGSWKDGQPVGQGSAAYSSGRYTGGWINGIENGYGVLNSNSGNRYKGEFKNGKKDGQGIYTRDDGTYYEGEFKLDKVNGKGTMVSSSGDCYEGEWKDGMRNGYVICTWAKGDRYEGEYKNDKRDGYGIYTWANGSRYEGEWKDGKRHGQGTQYAPNGEIDASHGVNASGLWRNGSFVINSQTSTTSEAGFSTNDAIYKAGVSAVSSMGMEKIQGNIADYQVQFLFSKVNETATTIEVSVPISIWLNYAGGSADTNWTATTVFNKSTGEIISFHVDK